MTAYSTPGVFNALDPEFGMSTSPVSASANATALQAAIDAAQASGNPNGAMPDRRERHALRQETALIDFLDAVRDHQRSVGPLSFDDLATAPFPG